MKADRSYDSCQVENACTAVTGIYFTNSNLILEVPKASTTTDARIIRHMTTCHKLCQTIGAPYFYCCNIDGITLLDSAFLSSDSPARPMR